MFQRLALAAPMSASDLKKVEMYADKVFSKIGLDIAFTKHFLERVNDPRNKKQITPLELAQLFQKTYAKFGPKLDKMTPGQEAVLNDPQTFINVPFVISFDPRTKQMSLVNKTVMRKPDFKSPDPILKV